MSILNIQVGQAGTAGFVPSIIYINTSDDIATVTTAGYLNSAHAEGFVFNKTQAALVYTADQGVVWCRVVVTGTPGNFVYSLDAI